MYNNTKCMYRDFDQDRDGKITRNEIRGFLLNLTDRKGEVERFLETVDEDNKGFVLHEGETRDDMVLFLNYTDSQSSKYIFQIYVESSSDSEVLLLFKC